MPVGKALVALTSAVVAGVSPARGAAGTAPATNEDVDLSFDPFSYQRRATETIAVAGIGDPGERIKLGGEELIRVVVRQANFGKIAHKIDKMGDYRPEIVYENANVGEVDPRDEKSIAQLDESGEARLVTVKDDVDLPMIAAFRLLAARLQERHPILLKDELVGAVDRNGAGRLGAIAPTKDFLQTLLIASTNIGSLLCDGIGDAILVQGEEAPGQALRLSDNMLQADGSRIVQHDYVVCPS